MTFEKNPGDDDDDWFNPSRVVDSYPWDKIQLQESTARFITKTGNGRKNYWTVSEGVKYNSHNVGSISAHAHWLTMVTGTNCDLYEETVLPAILYSKLAGPVYLATRSKCQNVNTLGPNLEFTVGRIPITNSGVNFTYIESSVSYR